jgi:hypothetical protein
LLNNPELEMMPGNTSTGNQLDMNHHSQLGVVPK